MMQKEKASDEKGKIERVGNHGEGDQRQAKARKNPPKQRSGRPGFAPEFDGLNCFETLISY